MKVADNGKSKEEIKDNYRNTKSNWEMQNRTLPTESTGKK